MTDTASNPSYCVLLWVTDHESGNQVDRREWKTATEERHRNVRVAPGEFHRQLEEVIAVSG